MTFEEWVAKYPLAAADLRRCYEHGGTAGGFTEAGVQAQIRVAAFQCGFALWRNNNGACVDETGRQLRFGLGNDSARVNKHWKSADLIGIGPGGRFMAVECKRPGWRGPSTEREHAQANMLTQVKTLGGVGFFATSVEDFVRYTR